MEKPILWDLDGLAMARVLLARQNWHFGCPVSSQNAKSLFVFWEEGAETREFGLIIPPYWAVL
jgi:hypothetical protein